MSEHPRHDPQRPAPRRPLSLCADGVAEGADGAPDPALAKLVDAVTAAPTAQELAGQEMVIEAFLAHAAARRPARTARPTRRRLAAPTVVAGRVAVGALVGVLTLGATTAAALTGTLPAPLQELAHQVTGVPRPAGPAAPGPDRQPTAGPRHTTDTGIGASAGSGAGSDRPAPATPAAGRASQVSTPPAPNPSPAVTSADGRTAVPSTTTGSTDSHAGPARESRSHTRERQQTAVSTTDATDPLRPHSSGQDDVGALPTGSATGHATPGTSARDRTHTTSAETPHHPDASPTTDPAPTTGPSTPTTDPASPAPGTTILIHPAPGHRSSTAPDPTALTHPDLPAPSPGR